MRRKVAECAGGDSDSAIEFGGAFAVTGNFTSPDGDETVQEAISFAPTDEAATERIANFAAPAFAECIQPVYEAFIKLALNGTERNLRASRSGS